jgi:Ca2+-binding RTX toxin-like protein
VGAVGEVQAVAIRSGTLRSDPIPQQFFGANFLIGRDSLSGSFDAKASYLGVTNLRYPGGGIAEDLFDINDPDNVPPSATGSLETLSRFLAYCGARGIAPVLVLPTKRYVDDPARGATEIARFVERVTSGEFGDVRVAAFEIGNEYYAATAAHDAISAADYAEVASRLAVAVREAARYPVDISVQIGKTAAENATILRAFDTGAERAAVSSLTYHDYPWTLDAVPERVAERLELVGAWERAGIRADLYLSEWNVGSESDAATDALHDYGMAQLPAMLALLAESAAAGVDRASVWGVQQRTKTALAGNEGDAAIWAAGHLLRQMAESLPGTRVLDLGAAAERDGIRLFAFESASELVVFVCAGDIDEAAGGVELRLMLDGLGARFGRVWAEWIEAAGDPAAHRPAAALSAAVLPLLTDASGRQGVRVALDTDGEVVRLVFTKLRREGPDGSPGSGVAGQITGTASDNVLRGTLEAETVSGLAGNDRLAGGGARDLLQGGLGHDQVGGGAGDDILAGGFGMDRLSGGDGRDLVRGGAAGDILAGQAGSDRLMGESGTDYLAGGAGDDGLWGGADPDVFLFAPGHDADRIADFEDRLDLIDVSALGITDEGGLVIMPAGADTLIDTGAGTIRLEGISLWQVTRADFIFA